MQPCYCALARTCSNFNRLQLRSKAVSGPRSWSPQTAITQTTFWDARAAVKTACKTADPRAIPSN